MKFRFNVNMTPEDYFELNRIVMFEMPAGKKIINTTRIIFAAFCAVAVLFLLSYFDFSTAGDIVDVMMNLQKYFTKKSIWWIKNWFR